MSRSWNAAEKVLLHAKLDPDQLLAERSQSLYFGSTEQLLDTQRVRLMEVDAALAKTLEEGEKVVLRGEQEENAVLCTQNKTYEIKEAETSNSLLLMDGLTWPEGDFVDKPEDSSCLKSRSVLGIFHTYLELKPSKPRMKKLYSLLSEKKFSGKFEHNEGATQKELEDAIQCSKEELLSGLRELDACFIGGRWVILENQYKMKLLSFITSYMEENSWKYDEILKGDTLDILKNLDNPEAIKCVFELYLSPNSDSSDKHTLNRDKVSRFYARYLLQTARSFILTDFMTMWRQSLPEDIEAKEEHLQGIAFIDQDQTPHTVRYFPESELPESIYDRLNVLFRLREKWTVQEMAPYIEPLTTPKLNVNALLTKYARGSTVKGVKYFSSKHGK